ncbi:MAG: M23 family metallopeptidase [Acidobacteriota bacterium]
MKAGRPAPIHPVSTPRGLLSTSLLLATALPLAAASPQTTSAPVRFAWPLEINDGFSSTFGEYRTNHLHGGIDFKTRGQSGFKVFAAADGEIFRIKCERRGYGKVIYVRHPDDWVTVYAHLEAFENEVLRLEDLLARLQQAARMPYPGDYYLEEPLPVSRGQVIGYSGESGAGLPHLHFETRVGELEQVNPFLAGFDWAGDSTPPTVLSATLIPDGAAATVMNGKLPRTVPFQRSGDRFVWQQPVWVEPPLRLLVTAFDVEGTTNNTCSLYSLVVSIDGDTIYRLDSDRFSLRPALRVGLVFDLNRNGKFPHAFTYTLDPRVSDYLSIAHSRFPVESLPLGIHHLEIVASDVWGNAMTAAGDLIVPSHPLLQFGNAREVETGVFELPWSVTGRRGASEEVVVEVSRDGAETFAPVRVETPQDASGLVRVLASSPIYSPELIVRGHVRGVASISECAVATVNLLASPISPIQAIDIDSEGRLTVDLKRAVAYTLRAIGFEPFAEWPPQTISASGLAAATRRRVFSRPRSNSRRLYAQIEFDGTGQTGEAPTAFLVPWVASTDGTSHLLYPNRNFAALQVTFDRPQTTWDGIGQVDYPDHTRQQLRFERMDERRFTASLAPPPMTGAAVVSFLSRTIRVDIRRVHADSSQRFVDGNFIVTFERGAAYSDFFLWTMRGQPWSDPLLRQVGDIFRLAPEGEPLADDAHIQMQYPSTIRDPLKLGIYSWDSEGFWVYENTGFDRHHRLASASVMRLGLYALLEDRARPTVKIIYPRPSSRVSRDKLRSLLVEIEDYGKGVDEGSIQVTLDGRKLAAYYDPDRHWAAYVIKNPLKIGRHTLRASARDLAGNYGIPAAGVFYAK